MTLLYPAHPILLVDDEELVLASLEMMLKSHGLNNILSCSHGAEALEIIRTVKLELVLLDFVLPGVSGEELLDILLAESPSVPVIIITGMDEADNAVRCIRRGAFDYLVKPPDRPRLLSTVDRAIDFSRRRSGKRPDFSRHACEELEHPQSFEDIVTCSRSMFAIFQYCEAIAGGREPVLITGETGVGKELVSQALHRLGRGQEPFVALNVAGLDHFMFSDTLFGHVRGAYTGASTARSGLAEAAGSGTLFLDEIGDLSEASQVKLLRLLQEREYRPLGSDSTKKLNARVVASTHRDLEAQPDAIRRDLYYRLRTHHIHVPPLRDRCEDIGPLLQCFLEQACIEFARPVPEIHPDVPATLAGHPFPGNIRELRAVVFDALGRCHEDTLTPKDFDKLFRNHTRNNGRAPEANRAWTPPFKRMPTLKEASTALVLEAVRRSDNNLTKAAVMLGISRQALSKRLKNINS